MDRSVFRRPTYAAFIALLDNYSAETRFWSQHVELSVGIVWIFCVAITREYIYPVLVTIPKLHLGTFRLCETEDFVVGVKVVFAGLVASAVACESTSRTGAEPNDDDNNNNDEDDDDDITVIDRRMPLPGSIPRRNSFSHEQAIVILLIGESGSVLTDHVELANGAIQLKVEKLENVHSKHVHIMKFAWFMSSSLWREMHFEFAKLWAAESHHHHWRHVCVRTTNQGRHSLGTQVRHWRSCVG
jgi:hypothetical protein